MQRRFPTKAPFAPKMHWVKGEMTEYDQFFRFALVTAPITEVAPWCIALVRALEFGAILTRGRSAPPYVQHRRLVQAKRSKPVGKDTSYVPLTEGFLVSTPRGAQNLTLIEPPLFHSLSGFLAKVAPHLEVLNVDSYLQNASEQCNIFTVYQDGEVRRMASSEIKKGRKYWRWSEMGEAFPFEATTMNTPERERRLDRPTLLSYAEEWGLDAQRHLFNRELDDCLLIERGQVMSGADRRERTSEFEAEYQHVLACGIGEAEPEDKGEAFGAYLRQNEALHEYQAQFQELLEKTLEKKEMNVEDIANLAESADRGMRDEVGLPANFGVLATCFADAAEQIDRDSVAAQNLRQEADAWSACNDAQFRLNQLLPDEDEAHWPDTITLFSLPRMAMEEMATTKETPEEAMRRLFFQICNKSGLKLDPKMTAPSASEAMSMAYSALAEAPPPSTSDFDLTAVGGFLPGLKQTEK